MGRFNRSLYLVDGPLQHGTLEVQGVMVQGQPFKLMGGQGTGPVDRVVGWLGTGSVVRVWGGWV